MSVTAILDNQNNDSNLEHAVPVEERFSWAENVLGAMQGRGIDNGMEFKATVHPCIINGERCLVYKNGLKHQDQTAYAHLAAYAEENGFRLKENQRSEMKKTRIERRAQIVPMLAFGAGLLMSQGLAADPVTIGSAGITASHIAVEALPQVDVTARKLQNEKAYQQVDGKRFVTKPFGEVQAILGVAAKIKAAGKMKRVSTRGITMPNQTTSSFVDRYDFKFSEECGGGKFSYYEADGFGALGYHQGKKVILDVLVGGGGFSSPKLWGPYDQVLNDNVQMHLMFGNGKTDGMGLLKSSYAIGQVPVMADEDFDDYGNSYSSGVDKTYSCLVKNGDLPDISEMVAATKTKGKLNKS